MTNKAIQEYENLIAQYKEALDRYSEFCKMLVGELLRLKQPKINIAMPINPLKVEDNTGTYASPQIDILCDYGDRT